MNHWPVTTATRTIQDTEPEVWRMIETRYTGKLRALVILRYAGYSVDEIKEILALNHYEYQQLTQSIKN